jgi:hypothetical protein
MGHPKPRSKPHFCVRPDLIRIQHLISVLLQHLRQLPRRVEQFQLRLLPRVGGI